MYTDGTGGSVPYLGLGDWMYCTLTVIVVPLYVVSCEPLSHSLSVTLIIHVSPLQPMLERFIDGSDGLLN